MERLFYPAGKMLKPGKKRETKGGESVMLKCLKFVAEKWNPYDSFPEENGYHTPAEVLEFLQTLLKD